MTPSALPVPSVFAPVSTPAFLIRDLSWLMLAVSAAIFAVVAYLLVYALVRYRARGGEDDHEPPQVYGSNSIEIAWIVVPCSSWWFFSWPPPVRFSKSSARRRPGRPFG